MADRLASALGQDAVSLVDCLRRGETSFTDDTICVVSPTYFWGLPSIVKEFLAQADLHADYLCFLATYGTTPGASDRMAGKAIRGRAIDAFYAVRMPDTWTPIFDLSTPEKVAAFTKTTEADIDAAIRYIGTFRKTSHLRVEEGCIGCGRCAANCPVQAIEMRERRPVWGKEKCAMCLGCLHRCPKFAIQYGGNTRRHGQYTHPKTSG